MPSELAASATARFRDAYGREPAGVWQAPGRVNLIGEHTDYNDGFVLPFALDRYAVVAAAGRDDGVLRLASLQREETAEIRLVDVGPGSVAGWAAYVAGSLWSLARAGVAVGGLDVMVTGDVPVGSGLSSSAALECAVVLAARDLFGGPVDRVVLARIAQRAENEIVGVPSGILDQMAALSCTADHALFLDVRSSAAEQVPLPLAESRLAILVIDTRTSHSLADGAYAERRRSCEEAARVLGVPALRDVSGRQLEAARDRLGEVRFRCARHGVTENDRVLAVVAALGAGRLADIGPALTASHVSLRDDYRVSSRELDVAVDAALDGGALGARMTGGGFGGCAIALVAAGEEPAVAKSVEDGFAARGFRSPEIFSAHPSHGARRIV
jgi:galactokinase